VRVGLLFAALRLGSAPLGVRKGRPVKKTGMRNYDRRRDAGLQVEILCDHEADGIVQVFFIFKMITVRFKVKDLTPGSDFFSILRCVAVKANRRIDVAQRKECFCQCVELTPIFWGENQEWRIDTFLCTLLLIVSGYRA